MTRVKQMSGSGKPIASMSANFHVLGSTFHPDPQLTEWDPQFENVSSSYIR